MRFSESILKGFGIVLLISCFSSGLYAQDCEDAKIFKKKALEGYTWTGQSAYARLSTGDTARMEIILYGDQEYKIYVGGEIQLGEIAFSVIEQVEKTKKIIKDIKEEEIVEYEVDEYGNEILDDNWEPIVASRKIVYDTIWEVQRYTVEKQLYHNSGDINNCFNKRFDENKHYIIEVYIPRQEVIQYGCVSIMIGHRGVKENKFIHYSYDDLE